MGVEDLPDDPKLLKRMLIERDAQVAERDAQVAAGEVQIARLQVELLRLKKWYYGPRADSLGSGTAEDVAQLVLDFARGLESLPEPRVEDALAIADDARPVDLRGVDLPTVRKVRHGRRNLAGFDPLPVVRKEHDLPDDQKPCPCCNQLRTKIDEVTNWQIEFVPGHFERVEHVRFKYACSLCERNALNPNIELADKPS